MGKLPSLEKEREEPFSQAAGRAARLGVKFGVRATFITCALAVLLKAFSESPGSVLEAAAKLFGSIAVGVLGAPAFVLWCFPFILLSGAAFGVFNLVLVRFLSDPNHGGPA